MKQCSKCEEWKETDKFYKATQAKDGLQSRCKECANTAVAGYRNTEHGKEIIHRINTSEKGKSRTNKYHDSEKGKQNRFRYRSTEESRQSHRAAGKKHQINNPQKVASRNAIRYAIAKGKIPRPSTLQCTECENQASQYHHYKGYGKEHRLDVIPLCIRCHRIADKVMQNNQKVPE